MASIALSGTEMNLIMHKVLPPMLCRPGFIYCLESMACVPDDEQLTDAWKDEYFCSDEEPIDLVVSCNVDEVYCIQRKQCVAATEMRDGKRPPVGCSKMSAAKMEGRETEHQPFTVCAAGRVFCASERVCVEMNDYNPFTRPQGETDTATSAIFTTDSSISSVRTATVRPWTEVHATAPPLPMQPPTANVRPTVIPAAVKEKISSDFNAFKETVNEIEGMMTICRMVTKDKSELTLTSEEANVAYEPHDNTWEAGVISRVPRKKKPCEHRTNKYRTPYKLSSR